MKCTYGVFVFGMLLFFIFGVVVGSLQNARAEPPVDSKQLGKLDGVASVYYFDDNEKGVRCYVRHNGAALSCVKTKLVGE